MGDTNPHTLAPMPRQQRLQYLDAMRGFAMILVVYSHVILMTMKINSMINYHFILFRMPLFFFLSGFLSYSSQYSIAKIGAKSRKRLRRQLLPTILLLLVYVVVFGVSFEGLTKGAKYGYWFTISMVETFLIFMAVEYISLRCNFKSSERTWTLIVLIAIIVSLRFLIPVLKTTKVFHPIAEFLSFYHTLIYSGYFFLGVLCRKYFKWFERVISRWWLPILLIPPYIYFAMHMIRRNDYYTCALGVMGILIVFNCFYLLRNLLTSRTIVGRALIYIGKNTLEIYLLHYFIITVLINMALIEIEPLYKLCSNPATEFFVVVVIALACIGIILLFNHLLRRYAPGMHHVIFGSERPKKP